jgi:hypothetical protein
MGVNPSDQDHAFDEAKHAGLILLKSRAVSGPIDFKELHVKPSALRAIERDDALRAKQRAAGTLPPPKTVLPKIRRSKSWQARMRKRK